MNRKKLLAPLLAGALVLGMLPPAPVMAAANKAVEVPVNFTNSSWEDDWDTTSRTQLELWGLGEPGAYSETYTVSYKLYIPESFIKEESGALQPLMRRRSRMSRLIMRRQRSRAATGWFLTRIPRASC